MSQENKLINSSWYFRKNLRYISIGGSVILLIIFASSVATIFNTEFAKAFNNIISNFLGPIVGFLVAIITFLAFFVQYVANERFQEQFKVQQSSDHFYKMLDIHIQNVDNFSIKSHRTEYENTGKFKVVTAEGSTHILDDLKELSSIVISTDRNWRNLNKFTVKPIFNTEKTEENISGKRTFLLMSKDLHLTIERVLKLNKYLNNIPNTGSRITYKQALKLSYSIFFGE